MLHLLLGTASRYFLEVARTGSVTEAAARLHVAASAVSRQIGKLEEGLGCALFERRARGMVLSEAGERLAAHLRHVAQDAERVLDEVRGLGAQRLARIDVASTDGFAAGFLPQVMADFHAANPWASVHLRVGSPADVSRWLLRGEVELGLKFSVAPERGLAVCFSARAPILAVMAPAHPLAQQQRIKVSELIRYPLALPDGQATARRVLDLVCGERGLQYQVAFGGPYATILALVESGRALTLSARLSVAHAVRDGRLAARPLDAPQFASRAVQLLALQGQALPGPADAFRAALVDALRAELPGRRSAAPPASKATPA